MRRLKQELEKVQAKIQQMRNSQPARMDKLKVSREHPWNIRFENANSVKSLR